MKECHGILNLHNSKKDKMRFIYCYVITTVLSLYLFVPRQSIARVPTGFHEQPIKSPPAPLVYDTSSAPAQAIIHQLDAYYKTQVKAGFNGSVLVGSNGKVIYERYYGLSNRESKIPLGPNNSVQLASISKTFTGASILYLYEHKYLNIDDPVQRYLPEFPYPNISVRMLLNHRSGLPDYTRWMPLHNPDSRTPVPNEMMLAMMAKYKPRLEFKPNTRFKYSNTNFAVLARVAEKITDMRFADFMAKYIFYPLGMDHTFVFDATKGLPTEATISYRRGWSREPLMFADGICGDKGIYSTVEDMYRWDQSLYQYKILTGEISELAYQPCSFERKGIKNYGLGWRMLCFPNGNKIIYHNGWWHGNNTSFYRCIKENFTIIVLGNRFTTSIYHQASPVHKIVLGSELDGNADSEE